MKYPIYLDEASGETVNSKLLIRVSDCVFNPTRAAYSGSILEHQMRVQHL